jgi:uncharacterized alpha-E superfamily protein
MLSRTADHLYWISRHMERAENIARFLDVANRLSLSGGDNAAVWQPVLTIAGGTNGQDEVTPVGVINWAVLDGNNSSSIQSCLRAARENAHAVRSAIPNELWESINSTWLEARSIGGPRLREMGLEGFLDWVKQRSHVHRGVTYGTMVRDEAFHFLRLGTFLERADNTARLLGVRAEGVTAASTGADAHDTLHWGAVLRSVGAFRAYRTLFKGEVTPASAADMLIMMAEMPRSLHACLDMVTRILDTLSGQSECARLAGAAHAELHWGRLDALLAEGLDTFVARVLATNNALCEQIHADFMMAA